MKSNIERRKSDKYQTGASKAFVALLILGSLIVPTFAGPFARAAVASTQITAESIPQPQPLPQPTPAKEKPLDEEAATALAAGLKEALEAEVEDEEARTAIGAKWEARTMAGNTRTQILAMLFADVKSVVTEKEKQDAVWEGWKAVGVEAEAEETTTSEEPKEEPKEETGTTPKTPTEPQQPTTQPGANGTLKQYIRNLSYDPRKLLAASAEGGVLLYDKPDPKKPIENMRKPGSGNITRCTKTAHNMKKNFEEIAIMQPTQGVIYPGALVIADKELLEGKPRPMNGLARAPIDLRLDLPGLEEEGSFKIANPTDGKVQTAINKSLSFWNNSPAFKEGYVNPSRSSFNATTAYSTEQLAIGLGFNAEWAQGAASAQLKAATNSEKNVVVAVYKQVFYTVTYDAPGVPEQVFDASVTAQDAKEIFNSDAPPAYVSSVSYGRLIMLRMETDKNESNIKAEAAFKYATGAIKVGGNLEMEYKKLIANSQFTVVTMGGNAEAASQSVSAKGPEDLFPIIKGKNAVYSKSNPGVPIAYSVKFLKDDRVALMGATTDYVEEKCETLNNLWLELRQNGVYVANFDVTWDEPGNGPNAPAVRQRKVEDHGLGSKMVVNFPGDATNIHVVLKTSPGRLIMDRFLTPDDLNKAFQTGGHLVGPDWSQECKDQTGKIEWKQNCK